ncbi:MAG: hypothetical protein HZC42_10535 [Candidatus Eisenbacteria bacterium]|nr:hypothetical protein [Candidatus Eisenbacteria bacterium]
MSQHASLSPERWARFTADQQLMMIANEMNRASKLMAPADRERLKSAYARVLQLTDLTVAVRPERGLRRELLRWRDLVAGLWLEPGSSPAVHREALRHLLLFSFQTARQIPFVLGDARTTPP